MSQATRPGLLPSLRGRLFGQRDPVDAQLRDIARQGSGMARVAHFCALLLIVLFSLGSLVALGGDALTSIVAQWQRTATLDLPEAISVSVSTLLVVCMDIGMVYAASMLRVLAARRADARERWMHYVVLVVVALLECATYVYMSYRYEHPANVVVWALIGARASAAPLLSVYLSLARPLPVGPRDILHEVALASGTGVIRDVVTIAADPLASLAQKAAIFDAAAVMAPSDRAHLTQLLTVVTGTLPTGPGSPAGAIVDAAPVLTPEPESAASADWPLEAAIQLVPGWDAQGNPAHLPKRPGRGRSNPARVRMGKHPDAAERIARRFWMPGMKVGELARLTGMSKAAASKWCRVLTAEQPGNEDDGEAAAV